MQTFSSQVTASKPQVSSTPLIEKSRQRALSLAKRQNTLLRKLGRSESRLSRLQNLRLWIGGIFFLGLVIAVSKPEWRLEPPLIALFALLFTPLVIATGRLKRFNEKLSALKVFLARQEARLKGEAPELELERAMKAGAGLNLKADLGTTGALSLFALLDETLTDEGEKKLLTRMAEPAPSRDEILKRQRLVKSLRRESWLYTRLALQAHSAEFRISSETALETIKHPFVPEGFEKRFYLNIAAWVLAVAAFFVAEATHAFNPGLAIVFYVVVGTWTMNRAEGAFHKGVGLENHLWLLAPLFARIEKRAATSPALQELMPRTSSEGPSREMRKLGRVLSFAGIQANPILMILVNAVLPWSITATYLLERRRQRIHETLPECLEELAELEVGASLMLLDRYQTDVYPEISDEPRFAAKSLFHPLLKRDRVVANDFAFAPGKTLGLLTGSNMSGKSTFLRTVGLNQILANMGGPVFAEELKTSPLDVETCIEVSDSLRDGFSYFYAEVRRLKNLIGAATRGPRPVLYLIDEIFRGTNNRERQIGSRAVIRALAGSPSLGFISTHDLELTQLEGGHARLVNLHFREEIREGAMHFTYALHDGPCPTTNALRIMEAEGIDVSGISLGS